MNTHRITYSSKRSLNDRTIRVEEKTSMTGRKYFWDAKENRVIAIRNEVVQAIALSDGKNRDLGPVINVSVI